MSKHVPRLGQSGVKAHTQGLRERRHFCWIANLLKVSLSFARLEKRTGIQWCFFGGPSEMGLLEVASFFFWASR